jgi:pimeloyl-ACP methyl ester carboxylesterase
MTISENQVAEQGEVIVRPGGPFVENSVDVDGVSIRYAQAGTGQDLVILPTSSGLTFTFGADLLAESFRVTMIEPPGWGTSPMDQISKPIPELAHTTAAAIAAMGIDRFNLAAGSIGGIHAFWLMALYPERIKTVITDGSMAFRKDNWATPGFDPVAFVRAAAQGADISHMLPRPHPKKPWATLEERQKQQKRILRVMEFTGPEFDEDLAARLRPLDIPVLSLFGANDHFVFPSVAKVYKRIFRRCETVIVEDAGHEIPTEQSELYAELVKNFIDSHTGAQSG